jgi:2-polyprenyl-3-methyl-5-hydroxy-6-metoxy-1,4-benzoquinol methylase
MQTLQNCPICHSQNLKPFLTCQDYTVSNEKFNISECADCHFKFTNPRPEPEIIGKYYQSQDYISHSDTNKGIINKVYQLVRNYTLQSKLKLIHKLNNQKTGKILDIGCGTGMFLKVCKDGGWEIAGTEPDDATRQRAQENSGVEIAEDFMKLEKGSFDIITMWHVLEHIHELDACVEQLKKLLSPTGILLIAVPNHESYDGQFFQEYWAAYDVPRHLSHFTQKNIKQLFEKNGMKLAATKPMWFDAFYISMLSTKYKTGKINYLQSFFKGLTSNNKASQNNQFSSLIYILKK